MARPHSPDYHHHLCTGRPQHRLRCYAVSPGHLELKSACTGTTAVPLQPLPHHHPRPARSCPCQGTLPHACRVTLTRLHQTPSEARSYRRRAPSLPPGALATPPVAPAHSKSGTQPKAWASRLGAPTFPSAPVDHARSFIFKSALSTFHACRDAPIRVARTSLRLCWPLGAPLLLGGLPCSLGGSLAPWGLPSSPACPSRHVPGLGLRVRHLDGPPLERSTVRGDGPGGWMEGQQSRRRAWLGCEGVAEGLGYSSWRAVHSVG